MDSLKATNFSPTQIRMARALLGWSQEDLAAKAKVEVSTVVEIEQKHRVPEEKYLSIQKTLEKEGIKSLPGDTINGPASPDFSREAMQSGQPVGFISATDLDQWADRRDSQAILPEVMMRLIRASTGTAADIEFPADESVQTAGWDGKCLISSGTNFIPSGSSGWELSTQARNIKGKANKEYYSRLNDPRDLPTKRTTFVFVTLRRWNGKEAWIKEKRSDRHWVDVWAFDADNLVHWIELYPAVGHWLAAKIGKIPPNLRQLADVADEWLRATKCPLSMDLMLAGRDKEMIEILRWIREEPRVFNLQAESSSEAIAFLYAALRQLPEKYYQAFSSRCLVASTEDEARRIGGSVTPLIIVMDGADSGLANKLANQGHHVFVSHGSDLDAPDDITRLTRPTRMQLHQILEDMFIDANGSLTAALRADIDRLSHDCGRSLVVLRRLMYPASRKPTWAQTPSRAIIAAMLAGAWDESRAGDKDILERLSGMTYDDLAADLAPFVGTLDSPIRKAGSAWKIASRQDAWFRLALNVSAKQFELFLAVSKDVMSTPDPRYDLEPKDRWLAEIRNIRPEYSRLLRHGLAETLILASLFGKQAPNIDNAAEDVGNIVQLILESADEKCWWSLSGDFRLLAEAAPDRFLTAVDQVLYSEKKPLRVLFQEDEGLAGGEYISNLLWALEMLAWNPNYLARVTGILAEFDRIDPGGRYNNRPGNSLREIFLLWFPQTYAALDDRLRVLDRLRGTHNDQAWKLMIVLLPRGHDTARNNPQPRWRDYDIDEAEVATSELIDKGAMELTKRILEDVSIREKRWVNIIDIFERLTPSWRSRAIANLAKAADSINDPTYRVTIWTALRCFIHRHRDFADEEWALPEAEVSAIELAYNRFSPVDIAERVAFLFDRHVKLLQPSHDDFTADDAVTERYQQQAVQDLLAAEGFDGLMRLASICPMPYLIGRTIANLPDGGRYFEDVFTRCLPAVSESEWMIARGLIDAMCTSESASWAAALVRRSKTENWGDKVSARILHAMPNREETWRLAIDCGANTAFLYWKEVQTFLVEGDAQQIAAAAEALLGVKRASAAVELLAHHRSKGFPTDLMMRALEQAAKEEIPTQGNAATMFQYFVEELFDAIDINDDAEKNRLAIAEWIYLSYLTPIGGSRRGAKVLHSYLATNPSFFIEVLSAIFRPAKDSGVEEPAPVDQKYAELRASQADVLLQSWQHLPGLRQDGLIDADVLMLWVKQARDLCKRYGRSEVGDLKIGEVLARAQPDTDGIWPPMAVCQVIESSRATKLENGFFIGTRNRRGVTSRSATEGGQQERNEAQKYRQWAEKVVFDWPRTAAVLEDIAKSYERDARRADNDAERNDW
ncbi:MAG TPA: hypothetical protein VHL08_06630 [Dongiaceae bacterium]|jgi:transcriptional regulator with XRE-family HTH domain/GNAT superfamily N-acetyltransferase|nr:hypothetical protein [Dongiaceae bacterium]